MNKKRLLRLGIVVSLITVLAVSIPLLGGCAAPAPGPTPEPTPSEPAAEAPIYHLRMQSIAHSGENPIVFKPMEELIEKMSGGRLTLTAYSSCELIPDEQMLPAVRDGVLDMANWCAACNPALTKLGYVETIVPCSTDNGNELESALQHLGLADMLREDYDEYGVHFITWQMYDPACTLISTKPIRKYEDLEGLKIATYEAWGNAFMQGGATVVNIPPDEFYTAGATGLIDGIAWGGAICYEMGNLHEVYHYYLADNPGHIMGDWIINQEVWDSLSEDLQLIIWAVCKDASWRMMTRRYWGESHMRLLWEEVTEFSSEDHAKFVDNARRVWPELAAANPETAEWIRILTEYIDELETTRWHAESIHR